VDVLKARAVEERLTLSAHIRNLLRADFDSHRRKEHRELDKLIAITELAQ
jgi:hypothetical protein